MKEQDEIRHAFEKCLKAFFNNDGTPIETLMMIEFTGEDLYEFFKYGIEWKTNN